MIMKTILIIIFFMILKPALIVGQQDTICYFLGAQERKVDPVCQQDTIDLYLEDTAMYIKIALNFEDEDSFGVIYADSIPEANYIKYMTAWTMERLILVDSLDDGYYRLYNISKKELKKKDKDLFLVAKGCYKNKLKQGDFEFSTGKATRSSGKLIEEQFRGFIDGEVIQPFGDFYIKMTFVNDTVNGLVIEARYAFTYAFQEYKMGIKDGFGFAFDHPRMGCILYYENDELLRQLEYDIFFKHIEDE